ncbi:MAG TPA: squalene/phytoene synthase family protein [Rhodanobacteraceae bacterium]|nr:squalene/phytoene synthase family protein [Rhodanobacteraceae bacterium]
MSEPASSAPLASFEAKWTEARPELALALRFERTDEREPRAAFACLALEIEHAAFGIREAQPAAIKLQWWAEELSRAAKGEARHPLTQALASRISAAAIPEREWHAAIVGAMAQRDPEPAADGEALLAGYAQLYVPLGTIESALFGNDATAVARALALSRAMRETAALPDALRDGKLPLPLDLLARHRLARGDLGTASAARSDALRDWFGDLAHGMSTPLATPKLGILRAAMAAADAKRLAGAAKAGEPLVAANAALTGLSIPVAWAAWRAARRSRR